MFFLYYYVTPNTQVGLDCTHSDYYFQPLYTESKQFLIY